MKKLPKIFTFFTIINIAYAQYYGKPENHGPPRKNMRKLVKELYHKGFYKSKIVEKTMMLVDRKFFCDCHTMTYEDKPFPLTYGSFIGAPSMHATALQLMKRHLRPNARALDIGSGSGYLTAAMSMMMGNKGQVIGIDHMQELVNKALHTIHTRLPKLLINNRLQLFAADGRRGYAPMAPYDVIHCGAFAETIPDAFKKQLKPGGRLVMALGKAGSSQQLITADLGHDGKWKIKNVTKVWCLPLTDPFQQIDVTSWKKSIHRAEYHGADYGNEEQSEYGEDDSGQDYGE